MTDAPFVTATQTVQPDWIDYNGHMNVAYYTMAFDRALEEVYEGLGIGAGMIRSHRMGPMALQTQIHYLREMLEGAPFHATVQILDHDAKRVHVFATLIAADGREAATYESLSINVDLTTRRATAYPPEALVKIEAAFAQHRGLPRPARAGAPLGIRRRQGA